MSVTELSIVKWKRLTTAFEAISIARREHWPEIAILMAELKSDFSSTAEFGHACFEHGIELNKDDRAAFIIMGNWKPADLSEAMSVCARFSPQHFVAEVKDMIPTSSPEELETETGKTNESDVVTEKKPESTKQKNAISTKCRYDDLWEKVRLQTNSTGVRGMVAHFKKLDSQGVLLETLEAADWRYSGIPADALNHLFSPRMMFSNLPPVFAKKHSFDYRKRAVIGRIKKKLLDNVERFRQVSVAVEGEPRLRAEIVAARIWSGEKKSRPVVVVRTVPVGVPIYLVNGREVFPARIDPTPGNIKIAECTLVQFKAQNRELASHGLNDASRALVFSQWQTWMRGVNEIAARVMLNCSQALDLAPVGDGKMDLPNEHDVKGKYGLTT